MSDLALDLSRESIGTPGHHDLQLGPTGDLQLTGGTDAILQAIAQALKQFSQDWFLNMDAGLPYRQNLFGGRDLSSSFEAVLQNRILNVPGVLGLNAWSPQLDRVKRNLTVQFEAKLTTGTVNWAVNLDLG